MLHNKMKTIVVGCWMAYFMVTLCSAESVDPLGRIIFVRTNDLWQYNFQMHHTEIVLKDGSSPSCSKDGKRLAFVRNGNIWLLDLEDMSERKITNYKDSTKRIRSIEWFPKGNKVAFSREDDYEIIYSGNKRKLVWPETSYEDWKTELSIRSIWITSLDGKVQEKWIGNVPGSGTTGTKLSDVDSPKWSPDGGSLVFSRNGDIWMASIFEDEVSPFNKKEKRFATVAYLEDHYGASGNSHFADHFSWTPDGGRIVYEIHRHAGSGFGEIWEINADGSEHRRLWSPNEESFPQLSPDGSQIAFIQGFSLWIMRKDGGPPEKLIDDVDRDQITWCRQK